MEQPELYLPLFNGTAGTLLTAVQWNSRIFTYRCPIEQPDLYLPLFNGTAGTLLTAVQWNSRNFTYRSSMEQPDDVRQNKSVLYDCK